MIGALLSASPSWALDPNALPTGGSIVGGSGSIDVNGNQLTVQQQSQQLIANWNTFNIGTDAAVRFMQPSSSSVALNRVLSNDASQIFGRLSSNGQVFLVNPNGVYFAPGASVNVGGLVGSTLDISNEDFAGGRYVFNRAGGTAGEVVNQGRLQAADGGSIALIGARVINDGDLIARNGTVALATADQVTLDFHGDGLLSVSVSKAALAGEVANRGLIAADGGNVVMKASVKDALLETVINNTGVIRARSIGMRDGSVVLDGGAEGVVMHSGSIDVSGLEAGEKGGSAKLLGDKVGLTGAAADRRRGRCRWRTVLVGGDYQGKGAELHATRTYVGQDVTIAADAINSGDGGKVIVWSDDATQFEGSISARGGVQAGNGGFVETSGKEMLEAFGAVDASAANGAAGTWLLDPRNVTISSATANGGFDGSSPNIFTPTGDSATINAAAINTSLNGGTSVTITTGSDGTQNGDITLNAGTNILKSAGTDATLRLEAARDININGTIKSTSNKLDVVLNAGKQASGVGSVSIGANGQVISNGGDITIGGGADPATTPATGGGVTTNGFRMFGARTSQSTSALLSSGAGNIVINAKSSGATSGFSLVAGSGTAFNTITSTTGNIIINATGGSNGINVTTGYNTIASTSGNISLNGIWTGSAGSVP